jgi:hypothetical protein
VTFYGYRYYDPVTGRWPSRDPIKEEGGVNLYEFCNNDGICKWDVLGKRYDAYYILRVTYKIDKQCLACCLVNGVWSLRNARCRTAYSNVMKYGWSFTKDYLGEGTDPYFDFSAEMNARDNSIDVMENDDSIPECYKYGDADVFDSDSWYVPDPMA